MLRVSLEAHIIAFGPRAKFLQAGGRLVGQFTDDCSVEKRLHLNRPGEVKLLGLGLRRLVPLLQDLGEGGPIDLDKLLKLVEIVPELLEPLL